MAGGGDTDGGQYSNAIGAVYVFNLIVGAGALSLPNAFSQAGILSGTLLLCGALAPVLVPLPLSPLRLWHPRFFPIGGAMHRTV